MKKALPYIAGAVLLIAITLLLIFHRQQRHFDGRITLNPKDKIPYGTYAAYQLLTEQFPGAKVSINKAAPENWKQLSYDTSGQVLLIVNSFFNPSVEELDHLTVFAQKGNTVFISALQMSDAAQRFFRVTQRDIYSPYGISQDNGSIKLFDSFSVSLDTAVYTSPYHYSYPGISYDNRFANYDSGFAYALGYSNKNMANLLAVKTQKGTLFLHAAPITFSNLFLLYNNNHLYFEKLMSLVPAGTKRVVWDEYFMYRKSIEKEEDDGVLSVLLSYQNFRWAFWLVIVTLILYIATEIKRSQRLIPAHTKPVNDSLEFVSTIGKLYYEKGDHKNLAEKLSVFFLDFIRNQYKIPTNEINEMFVLAVSLKTNVPQDDIRKIADSLVWIKVSESITQQQLMDYYRQLDHFYSKV